MDFTCNINIDCKQGAIRAVRYNVDGSYCISCGADKKIKLWNPYRNLLLKTYGGHGNEVLDACGSCDSGHIISCSLDKSVILWDVTTGQPLRRFRGHASAVTCVKFNEESTLAISGSRDNTVMFWDIRSRNNEPVQTIKEAKDCITTVQVTDHEILTSSLDCTIRVYDIRVGQMISDFLGAPVISACFTKDGQCVLSSCSDDTLRLIDKDTGQMLGEYKGHKTNEFSIECSVNFKDTHVLSGSANGSIFCWDFISGNIVNQLKHHSIGNVVHCVNVSPVKEEILSASNNNIQLWSQVEDSEDRVLVKTETEVSIPK